MNNSVLNRVSSRDFSDKSVSRELLEDIIKEAQLAPSWENSQPWKVYIATGGALKTIKASHKEKVENGAKSWTDVMPPQSWSIHAKENIDEWEHGTESTLGEENWKDFWSAQARLFNAPAIAYITMPKDATHFSAYDTGAFGYGILLAATDRGLSAIPAYEFIRFPEEVREVFGIPEEESVFMGIALGYPSESDLNQLKTKRSELEQVLQILD